MEYNQWINHPATSLIHILLDHPGANAGFGHNR